MGKSTGKGWRFLWLGNNFCGGCPRVRGTSSCRLLQWTRVIRLMVISRFPRGTLMMTRVATFDWRNWQQRLVGGVLLPARVWFFASSVWWSPVYLLGLGYSLDGELE